MADRVNSTAKFLCRLFVFLLIYIIVRSLFTRSGGDNDCENWFDENGLRQFRKQFKDAGCETVQQAAQLDLNQKVFRRLKGKDKVRIQEAILSLRDHMLLEQWLEEHRFYDIYPLLEDHDIKGFSQLEEILKLNPDTVLEDTDNLKEYHLLYAELPSLQRAVRAEMDPSRPGYELDFSAFRSIRNSIGHVAHVALAFCVCAIGFVWLNGNYQAVQSSGVASRSRKAPIIDVITGSLVDPRRCQVHWMWKDPAVVGDTMAFTIKFYQRNGMKYVISDADELIVEILVGQQKMACSIDYSDPSSKTDYNTVKCAFTVRKAGMYIINIRLGPVPIKGSHFYKEFLPGDVDPHKTEFVQHSSTVVLPQSLLQGLTLEPRDRFGNACSPQTWGKESDVWKGFEIKVTRVGDQEYDTFSPLYDIAKVMDSQRVSMLIKIDMLGCYKAEATYKETKLKNGEFNILVLSNTDLAKVNKTIKKKHTDNWYEATLLAINKERLRKPRKVYCYVTAKQFTVKEFYLMVIPKRLFTCRVCPSTKFHFDGGETDQLVPVFSVDDGGQPPITLASKHRDIMAAVYTKFLLGNIGGSETFQDKQKCFHREVLKLHVRKSTVIPLRIDRLNLLESSMKATKGLSTSDWCKKFEIKFTEEEGLDWGGLMREWMDLLCVALFDPENKLFKRFETENHQAPVHPNPNRPSYLSKLKYYEFAGKLIGKCLYECAVGSNSQLMVKAKFSRSFLAQLIGLRVTHMYFETDDTEFYTTKVRYIRENEVESLDMKFSEEIFDGQGNVEQVVELLPGGADLRVTEDNKMQYLDLLAQYRLAATVQDEIEAFLKGLNDLIPDNLLSMFDENELELLMCGTCCFDLADLKANVNVAGFGSEFQQVVEWFWIVVASFTQEEMSRLLQFTTGSSQLPPGGFSELKPKFQLTSAPTFGVLPTAHTCFNQLCLPSFDSIEHLQKSLVMSITEGVVGFGMI